jgi:steroid delta-isomerase-like uncharacterized protein
VGNIDKHRQAHEAFNRRDWDGVVRDLAPDVEYTDHPRSTTTKNPQQFVEYLKGGWVTGFSDATVSNVRYTEGGDRTIAQFDGTGVNDGPLGPMPATGKTMSMPFCEVMTYDADGRIVRGELYYDQVTMLVQLGHMPPPAS